MEQASRRSSQEAACKAPFPCTEPLFLVDPTLTAILPYNGLQYCVVYELSTRFMQIVCRQSLGDDDASSETDLSGKE